MIALPRPDIEVIENAIVVPPGAQGRPRTGVFDAKGAFVPASATLLSHEKLSVPPALPEGEATDVRGTHFYAGLGRLHFGHYLLESAARFWALPGVQHDPESILYTAMPKANLTAALGSNLSDLHGALAMGFPPHVTKVPLRVERLVVPTQGFGHGPWIEGTQEFRDHVQAVFQDIPEADGPNRLYISRNALRMARQRIDQETALEDRLRARGYHVFHPERHDLTSQIAHYRAAGMILGGDGSAFHLAAFAMRPGTRVGLIQRRNRPEMLSLLSRQIMAWAGVAVECFDPTLPIDAQRRLVPEGADAPTPINLPDLLSALAAAGFL